jgi:ribosomal protein L11 methyltransferase
VDLIQADARHFAHLPADLVLANIHLDVLLDLLAIPEFLNKEWYIFSGILGAQLEQFRSRLAATPLTEVATLDENLWFSVLARGTRELHGGPVIRQTGEPQRSGGQDATS